MRRILIVATLLAVALPMGPPAAAAPTGAHNYEAIPASCDGLGEVVIEVTSLGQWGTGKVQGTSLTLVPRSFAFVGTLLETGEVVFEEAFAKTNSATDDVCVFSFVEEIPPGDPFLPSGGTVIIEGTVGVRIVGT